MKKKDKWGYIDSKIKLIIPYKYGTAGVFMDGIAVVKEDSLYTIINTKGNEMVMPQFRSIRLLDDYLYVNDGKGYGLMDKKGNWILPCAYSEIEFVNSTILRVEKNEKFAYYNLVKCEFTWKEKGLD